MLYSIIFIGLVDLLSAIVCVLLAQSNPHHTDGIKLQAEYVVSIDWDKMVDADVDLWAAPPPGTERPVLYNNREEGDLALDRDSRGFLDDLKIVDGKEVYLPHREVITMRGIIPGRYSFGTHLYQFRRNGSGVGTGEHGLHLPVHYLVQKLNPVVVTVAEGEEILDFVGDANNFASFDIHADGSYTLEDPPLTPIANQFYKETHGSSGYGPGVANPSGPAAPPSRPTP